MVVPALQFGRSAISYYVGIDVAERQHRIAVLDASGESVQKLFSISNDRDGIEALLQKRSKVWRLSPLMRLSRQQGRVLILR